MKMSRVWAMPTADTFQCKPIGEFVSRWTDGASVIIDPFARNSKIGTHTNDLNPDADADYSMDALEFLDLMELTGLIADVMVFDPPYSPRQMKEVYSNIGLNMTQRDGQRPQRWKPERDITQRITRKGAICLTFGWNTTCMGKTRNWRIEEILLVAHGSGHNDTICLAERKL